MAIADSLRQMATEIVEQTEQRVAYLERDILEIEERLAEKKAECDAASRAPERLLNFPVQLGGNYQCPGCWIADEFAAPLTPIPGDLMRCGRCGNDWQV